MNLEEIINIVMPSLTLIGILFMIYKKFSDPDIKADKEIAIIKANCDSKHKYLDNDIVMIRENHLKHIESDIAELKNNVTKILTILEERDKK